VGALRSPWRHISEDEAADRLDQLGPCLPLGTLKQFDRIPGGILTENLLFTRPNHNFTAKLDATPAKFCDQLAASACLIEGASEIPPGIRIDLLIEGAGHPDPAAS
jgi:hypothetical protein